jgi:hypothetical protein
VVVALAIATPRRSRTLDALLLLAALQPLVLLLVVSSAPPVQLTVMSATMAFTTMVALVVTVRCLRESGFTPRNVGLGLAGLAQLLAAASLLFSSTPGATIEHCFQVLLVGVLGALAEPATGEPPRVLTSLGLVLLAAATYVPVGDDPEVPRVLAVALAQLVLGGTVAGAVFVGRARRFPTRASRAAAVATIILFAHVLLGRVFFATIAATTHLSGTFFIAALAHATAFTLLTGVLADWLRRREARAGLRHAPAAGVIAAGGGALVVLWAYARLGADGMPLGYLRYLERFTEGHIVAAIGGIVWFLGMLTVVTTTRRGRERPAAEEVFA